MLSHLSKGNRLGRFVANVRRFCCLPHFCLKISFAFLLTLVIVRKVVVNCRCLGTSGALH